MDDFDWTAARPHARRYPELPQNANICRFLHAKCGAGVKFDRPFMQWIKDGTPKMMAAFADKWRGRQGDPR